MLSAYLQWQFHSGERVVARGPLVSFVTKQKWIYKKLFLFHWFISFHLVLLQALNKFFGLFHPVSDFFLYILFVSFVKKQKWLDKKKVSISSFHFVSPCFVTSFDQGVGLFHIFYLLRNRNGFIRKSICFIVSFSFALFSNEQRPRFLVCFILFQSFPYIS